MYVYICLKIWLALEYYYSGIYNAMYHAEIFNRAIAIYIGDMWEHKKLCVTSSRLIFDNLHVNFENLEVVELALSHVRS